MVYVLNKDGKPLMPTKRYAKIRYVVLKEIKKVPKVKLLTPYKFRNGLAF